MNNYFNPETDVCEKCNKIHNERWKRYKTYKGIDKHHNPPEFISDFFKEEWSGEFYNLCRDCHRKLHDLIIEILNKHSNSIKFVNSEYWIMQKMTPIQIREAEKEIIIFTKNWIKEENENTNTIKKP